MKRRLPLTAPQTQPASRHRRTVTAGLATLAIVSASGLQAHTGVDHGSHHTLFEGLLHPMTGLDHLVALLGVGLMIWLTRSHRALLLAAPVGMLLGALASLATGHALAAEPMILTSLVCLSVGFLLLPSLAVSPALLSGLVGLFAFFHGAAHGTEMPTDGSAIAYFSGFLVTTVALTLLGRGLGRVADRLQLERPTSRAAAVIAGLAAAIGLAA